MAFVNLNYLFDVLKELRNKFPEFEKLGFNVVENKSSASCGVVIAHYKTPLSEVLKWARKMEHEAKENGERDAFAFAVLKHSGEIHKTVWKWQMKYETFVTNILKNIIKELSDDKGGFSNNFIKMLDDELRNLDDVYDSIIKTEIKRLLRRSSMIKNNKEKKAKKVNKWTELLFEIYSNAGNKNNFLSFLNIADFLERCY